MCNARETYSARRVKQLLAIALPLVLPSYVKVQHAVTLLFNPLVLCVLQVQSVFQP